MGESFEFFPEELTPLRFRTLISDRQYGSVAKTSVISYPDADAKPISCLQMGSEKLPRTQEENSEHQVNSGHAASAPSFGLDKNGKIRIETKKDFAMSEKRKSNATICCC